jgi:integrase
MPNSRVTLMRRCKTENGWKHLPVAKGRNGRIRPDYVLVEGQQVCYPEGYYELRFFEGRKLRYENVGTNAARALNALLAKEKLLRAKTAAQDAGVVLVEVPGRTYLRKAALMYITDRKNQGHKEAARDAEVVTGEFISHCGKTFLDEVTKDDVIGYHKWLRQQAQTDRTVANKHQRLRSFFLSAGVDVTAVMPAKPKYEKQLPTVYNPDQLTALLGAADDYMRLVIELGTKCGLRELEMVYLEWPDIHWQDKVLRVQGKPAQGFKVKDSEQRDIPIPDDLLDRLKKWREEHPGQKLILGTKKDNPNMHLLRQLKRLANREKLNCGVCEGCTGDVKECQEWTLHKLRRTYATTLLRNGIDLRTVQHFMGHADLASTSRYLRPAGSSETQSAITNIFAAVLAG